MKDLRDDSRASGDAVAEGLFDPTPFVLYAPTTEPNKKGVRATNADRQNRRFTMVLLLVRSMVLGATSKCARLRSSGPAGGGGVTELRCVGDECDESVQSIIVSQVMSENLMVRRMSIVRHRYVHMTIVHVRTSIVVPARPRAGAARRPRPSQPPTTNHHFSSRNVPTRRNSYLSHSSRHQEEQCHIRRPSAPYR